MGVSKMNQAKKVLLLFLLMNIANCIRIQCREFSRAYCSGEQCTITCSDGRQEIVPCPGGVHKVDDCRNGTCDIQCAEKIKSKPIKFKPCFPFCGGENPILKP